MRDRIFGWSLPPGCGRLPGEEPIGPCDVCGRDPESFNLDSCCICPECQECGSQGDPKCYDQHGMVRTPEQISSRAAFDDRLRIELEGESKRAEEAERSAKEWEEEQVAIEAQEKERWANLTEADREAEMRELMSRDTSDWD